MAWTFLWLNRSFLQGSNHDGTLYIQNKAGKWERLCYVHELLWKLNSSGRSKKEKSRIRQRRSADEDNRYTANPE